MKMTINDFIEMYGTFAEDTIWDIQKDTKKLGMTFERFVQYGEIEILKDKNTINYYVGITKPGIKELMLNPLYTHIDNTDRVKWDDISDGIDEYFPIKLYNILEKEEKEFYND